MMNIKRRFSKKDLALAVLLLALSAGGALASVPGIHRIIAPQMFGMTQIDDAIFIDRRIEAKKALAIIAVARAHVSALFGKLESEPRIIICAKKDCFERMGGGPRGITYGDKVIKIGPKGFNEMIITHELFHAELHKRMGAFGMISPVIPAWFDEGMATIISDDNRYREKFSPDEIVWIKQAVSYWGDLGERIAERGWRDTYGASKAAVMALKNEIGPAGIKQIIDLVTKDGIEFNQAVSTIRAQKPHRKL